MKKNRLIYVIPPLLLGLAAFWNGCSKPENFEVHPDYWMDSTSENFHGEVLAKRGFEGLEACRSCHGEDLKGGKSGVSCYKCHTLAPAAHTDSSRWMNPASLDFHGLAALQGGLEGLDNCRLCHGDSLTGGAVKQSCYECHSLQPEAHDDSLVWMDTTSSQFHGLVALKSGLKSLDNCRLCHGDSLTGGAAEQSCTQCHGVPPTAHFDSTRWMSTSAGSAFHGFYLRHHGWDFGNCTLCHGADFEGGAAHEACTSCHNPMGNCTMCHGNKDTGAPYPPRDLWGNTSYTNRGVGAHVEHMTTSLTSNVTCQACHIVPTNFLDPGHLGSDNRAEVNFDSLATNSGALSTLYDADSLSCQNVYCHGSFTFYKANSSNQYAYADSTIRGNYPERIWNSGEALECGSCHDLPPKGHFGSYTQDQCTWCHSTVVDNQGQIIAPDKHINGQIDLN